MKLAIVFLLFSIAVLSDAFARDVDLEEAKKVAKRQISLLNVAVTTKNKYLIRELYELKPDNDANADKIIAEYRPFKLEVNVNEVLTGLNSIAVGVDMHPKGPCGRENQSGFLLEKFPRSLTGWKIVGQ